MVKTQIHARKSEWASRIHMINNKERVWRKLDVSSTNTHLRQLRNFRFFRRSQLHATFRNNTCHALSESRPRHEHRPQCCPRNTYHLQKSAPGQRLEKQENEQREWGGRGSGRGLATRAEGGEKEGAEWMYSMIFLCGHFINCRMCIDGRRIHMHQVVWNIWSIPRESEKGIGVGGRER